MSRSIALPPSADIRLCMMPPHHLVIVAPPPVKANAAGIAAAPRRRPMLCASCPRALRGSAYSFVVALPARDDPTQLRCAVEPDAITAKAVTALRKLWPDLRPIAITQETGTRA